MRTIDRHVIKLKPGIQTIFTNEAPVLLNAQAIQDAMFVWFEVESEKPFKSVALWVVGDGQEVPVGCYHIWSSNVGIGGHHLYACTNAS